MKNEIRDDRLMALTVPCTYCHQPTGQECVNKYTGQPLTHLAAHWMRIKTASEVTPF